VADSNSDCRKIVNASGFAFQIAIEHAARSANSPFKVVATEHGWQHPSSHETGYADIVLEESNPACSVRLVLECKRTTEQGRWIFLTPHDELKVPQSRYERLYGGDEGQQITACWTAVAFQKMTFGTGAMKCTPHSIEAAFCTVLGHGEGQRPMLERVATEVVRATEAISHEQLTLDRARVAEPDEKVWITVPVIVTNAQLIACSFDSAEISLKDGLLPIDAEFKEVSVVRFIKNLSTEINPNYQASIPQTNAFKDRTVLVVRAESFGEFLCQFSCQEQPDTLRRFLDRPESYA